MYIRHDRLTHLYARACAGVDVIDASINIFIVFISDSAVALLQHHKTTFFQTLLVVTSSLTCIVHHGHRVATSLSAGPDVKNSNRNETERRTVHETGPCAQCKRQLFTCLLNI